jgi:hypothetical protein
MVNDTTIFKLMAAIIEVLLEDKERLTAKCNGRANTVRRLLGVIDDLEFDREIYEDEQCDWESALKRTQDQLHALRAQQRETEIEQRRMLLGFRATKGELENMRARFNKDTEDVIRECERSDKE